MAKTDIKYGDYQKMIYKMAWKFHWNTGLDWDDLFAQGNLIYCDAVNKWDPKGGAKFSAYLYRRLHQYLLNYVTIPYQKEAKANMPETRPSAQNVEREVDIAHRVANLSKNAQFVVKTVLNTPKELVEETMKFSSHVVNRQRLITYFRQNHQWSIGACERAFNEIKHMLAMKEEVCI